VYNTAVLVVGLTGNYGTGKSSVLSIFGELGAFVVDADRIVDSLLEDGIIMGKIREMMGGQVFSENGRLDRTKVAAIIFEKKELRDALEGLLHPLVFQRMEDILGDVNGEWSIAVVEVPLLFEKGYARRFDRTITVYAEEEASLRRLEESGVQRADALTRMRAQMPILEKTERSDYVIDNSGSIDQTRSRVEEIYGILTEDMKASAKRKESESLRKTAT
jgi:dephospho-CoA kinase